LSGPARAWVTRHQTVSAAAVYVVLALLLVGPGLLPGRTLSSSDQLWSAAPWAASAPAGVEAPWGSNFEQSDSVTMFQPFLEHTRDALPGVPLWNPHVMAGRPYLANMLSAVFSPFSVPSYVLGLWSSLALVAGLRLFTAALGTFLLGRALGMRFPGALLAGIVFGYGLFAVSWVAMFRFSVFALLPWLLLLTVRVVARPGPLPVAGLAALVAVQFLAGMPEASAAVLIATVAFFAWRVWARRGERAAAALRFALALVAGTALAALVLLPFAELLFHSYDYELRSLVGMAPLPGHYGLSLFLPDRWGRLPHTAQPFVGGLFVDRAFYVGALSTMLAAAALVLRPERERIALALFAALALCVVFGVEPAAGLFRHLPVLETMKVNYLLVWFVLPVALLAGHGLDDLMGARGRRISRRRAVLLAAGALLLAPAVWLALAGDLDLGRVRPALSLAWGSLVPQAGGAGGPDRDATLALGALLEWLLPAGAALALLALRLRTRRPLPAATFAALALALVAADLLRTGLGVNPVITRTEAVQPATPAIDYLRSRRPARFVGVTSRFLHPLPPNLAMRYGLYDARGYDVPVDLRFGNFWATNVHELVPGVQILMPGGRPSARAMRALSLLGVADVLQDPADPPLRMPGLRLAYRGADARVYANERALPRTFLVDRQRVVSGWRAALDAVSAPGFRPRREAVAERAIPGLPAAPRPGAPPGSARLAEYGGDRALVRTRARRRSLLVLSDTWARGWKAEVDGTPAEVHRVDYLLRGVMVPAGSHRVEFRYEPASWLWGRLVSLAALLALGAAVAIGLLRRRRRASGIVRAP
jgi:hypothetical protein